jgi:hypothetical protein
MAIWKKSYLQVITRSGETPWEFEHKGTARSGTMDGEVWAVLSRPHDQRVMTHINGIIRGKLTGQARTFLEKEGLKIPEGLPVNTKAEEFYWFSAPQTLRKAMDFINKNIYSFLWKNRL